VRIQIKKWGNSASVRIPAAIMQAARLKVDAAVDMHEEGGRIILQPVLALAPSLDALLAAITPDNLHAEADFGKAVGKEWR